MSLYLRSNSPVSNSAVPDVRETTKSVVTVPSIRLVSSITAKSGLVSRFVIVSPCSKIVLLVSGVTADNTPSKPVEEDKTLSFIKNEPDISTTSIESTSESITIAVPSF